MILSGTMNAMFLKRLCRLLKTMPSKWNGEQYRKILSLYSTLHFTILNKARKGEFVAFSQILLKANPKAHATTTTWRQANKTSCSWNWRPIVKEPAFGNKWVAKRRSHKTSGIGNDIVSRFAKPRGSTLRSIASRSESTNENTARWNWSPDDVIRVLYMAKLVMCS